MTMYNENLRNYVLDVINRFDVSERCIELSSIFARCNLRDLQDLFPILVQSIFGVGTTNIGWGLRTICPNTPHAFQALREFLHPTGTMLALCYRLLNDAIKFEFEFAFLPHKVAESIRTGHCSQFYSDLLNVDPIRRQISSLSLNAFDFYMLHFIIHGTLPLHKMHPTALYVHNEYVKTVYFYLCGDYLCNFLPGSVDGVVLPTNVCVTVKAPQPMQTLQPALQQRSPKYLKLPNVSLFGNNNTLSSSPPGSVTATTNESPRTYAWRSESVLNLFIDIWLRYDIDEVRDLPGSEFIRVVRLLVKQSHTFANAALLDHTAMSLLRKQAQPMMKMRIYPFLKSIISRWPLDGSLIVVLELWLSYIQPWRYLYEMRHNSSSFGDSLSIRGFESFIVENLIIYTQIFAFVLARFERLDFALLSNASMLFRLVKVFSQKHLAEQLSQAEAAYLSNNAHSLDSPQRRVGQYMRPHAMGSPMNSFETTWDAGAGRFYHDEVYIPFFGIDMQAEVERFIRIVHISRKYVLQEIQALQQSMEAQKTSMGYLKRFLNIFLSATPPVNEKLQKVIDVPELLNASMRGLSCIFRIDLQNIIIDDFEARSESNVTASTPMSLKDFSSGSFDLSTLSPFQMRRNASHIRASIDPALYPIESHECAFLVRFLQRIACKLNEMFNEEMQFYWNRPDIWGRLTKQLLYPPMTAQWFGKPRGVNELCEERLPARLILRPLGSYRVLTALGLLLLIGQILWGAPSYGVVIALLVFVLYVLIKALI